MKNKASLLIPIDVESVRHFEIIGEIYQPLPSFLTFCHNVTDISNKAQSGDQMSVSVGYITYNIEE